jgi:GNAT superfamily N-acetyltransferase
MDHQSDSGAIPKQNLVEDLGHAHYRFLGLWPGAVETRVYGALLAGNRLAPAPFRCHATFVRTQPDQVTPLIHAVESFYRDLGALPAFQLDPGTLPPDFAARVQRAGFRHQVDEAWMVYDAGQTPGRAANPAVTLEVLAPSSPDAAIQAYIDSYNINFRTPPHAVAGFGESFRGVLAHPLARHYLARVQGEPAGALSLFAERGFGCVYNVGVFPTARGHGVGMAMLQRVIDDAAALGVHSLFLQAVHQGPAQPLYMRAGFRTAFLRAWYLPGAPGGIWSP